MDDAAHKLAEFAYDFSLDKLADEATHALKLRLLDALATSLAAAHVPPVEAARTLARATSSDPAAQVLITGETTTMEDAAYANALMVQYWDYADVYLHGGHPSTTLGPVLAVAGATGASGRDALQAMAIAYETFCCLSDSAPLGVGAGPGLRVGTAAALAASRLLGLNVDQTAEAVALTIAGSMALVVPRDRQLSSWRVGSSASGSYNGVRAARAASAGVKGPVEPFIALGAGKAAELVPLAGRGRESRIRYSLLKPRSAEYHAQASIAAALQLRDQINVPDITGIDAYVYAHALGGIGRGVKLQPNDVDTALHSLSYLVSAALLDGDVSPAQFTPERMALADVRGLMTKVTVQEDPAYTEPYHALIASRLEITTTSGKRHTGEVRQPKGHYENPMTDAEVEAKFRRYAAPLLSTKAPDSIIKRVWTLESEPDLTGLLADLRV
jgi:2-methylcitrate dehydratase